MASRSARSADASRSPSGGTPAVTVTDGEQTTRYRTVAAHFEDATKFFPVLGRYEVWQPTTPRPLPSSPVALVFTSTGAARLAGFLADSRGLTCEGP